MAIKYLDAKRLRGLSSDTKPSNVPDHTLFEETDTYSIYGMTDSEGTPTWVKWYPKPARAVFCGGTETGSESSITDDTIDYISVQSTGTATDFGDLTRGRNYGGTAGSSSRAIIQQGDSADYIQIDTTGNASVFGDVTTSRIYATAMGANQTRAINMAGYV